MCASRGCTRETGELTSVRTDAPVGIERSETPQQVARAAKERGAWRIKPAQRRSVARAPAGELEGERRKIGLENLRRREGRESCVRARAPGAIAHARCVAAGAPLALLGGGARDALRFQPAHAGHRIKARAAYEARIDDHAHARDGEAGLGNVGGEHDLALPGRGRRERGVLGLAGELAKERPHLHRRGGLLARKRGLHAPYLARPGQKHQHIAGLLAQRAADQLHHASLGGLARACTRSRRQQRQAGVQVARRNRKYTPRGADERRIADEACDGGAVQGGGHDEQAQPGI